LLRSFTSHHGRGGEEKAESFRFEYPTTFAARKVHEKDERTVQGHDDLFEFSKDLKLDRLLRVVSRGKRTVEL